MQKRQNKAKLFWSLSRIPSSVVYATDSNKMIYTDSDNFIVTTVSWTAAQYLPLMTPLPQWGSLCSDRIFDRKPVLHHMNCIGRIPLFR